MVSWFRVYVRDSVCMCARASVRVCVRGVCECVRAYVRSVRVCVRACVRASERARALRARSNDSETAYNALAIPV